MTDIGTDPAGRPFDLLLAGMIDHTLLHPAARRAEIERLCREARDYRFAAVCIQPQWVPLAVETLGPDIRRGERPRVCTVVGFPHGAQPARVKAFAAAEAVAAGATEIDRVIPIGSLKDRDLETVERHIAAVVRACRPGGAVKVILETCLLSDEEKRLGCEIALAAGAAFVKTSTGFAAAGATEADVRLMRRVVGDRMGVKAAGGIRTREAALRMVAVGASRIGASAGIALVALARGGPGSPS
jgi:deoxyribose-phosphate aldolase